MAAMPSAEAPTPAAPVADASIEQLFTEHRCPELEALWGRSPESPRAAYFVGMCRMQAGEMEAAEEAFDRASSADEWVALASFMRGLTRLRQGQVDEARLDLESAMARADLPADVGDSGRKLMGAVYSSSVHGAVTAALDYDSNALLHTTGDNAIGVLCPPDQPQQCRNARSSAFLLSGVLLWNPADWSSKLVLLQRQVLAEPTATISAVVADATRKAGVGRLLASYGGGVSGYLLTGRPFMASAYGRGSLAMSLPNRRRIQGSASLRWQQFSAYHPSWDPGYVSDWSFNYTPLTGADAFLELEGSQPVVMFKVPFMASVGLTQSFFWTRGSTPGLASEQDQNATGGWAELKWTQGDFSAKGRAIGEIHLYRHPQVDDTRGNRVDLRGELMLSGSWAFAQDTSLDLDVDLLENYSYKYAIYTVPRQLVRVGVTRAF